MNPQAQMLPRGSIGFALGIAGMLCSLYFSIEFIAGNATGAELIVGVVFALILDYGKVSLASEAMLAMIEFRLLSAVVYTLIVICLYCLSMLAATFALTGHNTSAIVTQSDARIASIQQSITEKKAEIKACNSMALSKCVNPRTAELTALQAELSDAQNVSKEVIDAKNQAATWEKLAKTLGTTSENLQVKLAFARAVLLEIISPIFVSLFLAAYRKRMPQPAQYIPQTTQYAQPTHNVQIEQPPQPSAPVLKQSGGMDMARLSKKA